MNTALVSVCTFPRKALWLLACIAKSMRAVPRRRVAPQGRTFEMLEPCDGKLSSTVLRGERGREAPDLPGQRQCFTKTSQRSRLSFRNWKRTVSRQLTFYIRLPNEP